jgi:hypothetical protein
MPTDVLRLGAIAANAIIDALPDWAEAERLIRRGHRAAYLAGLAERLGVPLDSALLSEKRLSRAERKEVDRLIDAELKYWKGFESEKADLSQGQTDARAAMYGRATRGTYSKARWADWDLPFHPTEGSECMSNCLCHWTVEDNGDGTGAATWHLGATERHCTTCPSRASDSPYSVRRQ